MKHILLLSLVLGLALAGCGQAPKSAVAPAALPDETQTPQVFAPIVEKSGTPQAQVFVPLVRSGGECTTHTAVMTLAATATTLQVGQVVTVTVTLANQGCASMGMPQYRLAIQPEGTTPIFDPADPQPVTHGVGLGQGNSDTAEFVLQATAPGRATLSGSASFEVHLGYPGPAYWGSAATDPLVISVTP